MQDHSLEMSREAAHPQGTAAPWRLDLLGRVQLRDAQNTITRWPSRAVTALAARLALAPLRSHPREELIELLWPGVELAKGRQRLRQALTLLRGMLRDSATAANAGLLSDRLTVRLNPMALDCDVLQFERCVGRGELEQAQSLYLGDLMPGFYDDWIVSERHRLLALSETVQQGLLAKGQQLPAGQAATQAVQRPAPTVPPPALDPSAATRSPATRLPASLPAYWTRAFGQQPMLAQLLHSIDQHRLVTLIGPGGQGKTRLAVAAARQLAAAEDTAKPIFVSLADAHTAASVWHALALRLCEVVGTDPQRQVLAWIGQQALLLVLDNVEQLDAHAPEALTRLLQACPQLHLLLTSRRRLGLSGEQLLEMRALPIPMGAATEALAEQSPDKASHTAIDWPATLQENPAVAMFIDRARESRPEFHLTAGNAEAVVDLVRLLGGVPLAIELAASRLRALQPRELLLRLRQGCGSPSLDLLARPAASAGQGYRHASMRHVVSWSWQLLQPEVADLLRAMSVFGAPASAQAMAQALYGLRGLMDMAGGTATGEQADAPTELAQIQAWLADAVDVSMVQVQLSEQAPSDSPDSGPVTLYLLLQPVREYAAEQCSAAESAAARASLRDWLAALARQGLPQNRLALQPELKHAWALLLSARQDGARAQALDLSVALQSEWSWHALAPEFLAPMEWALAESPQGTPQLLLSQAHYLMACLAQLRNEPGRAAHHAQQALAHAPDPTSQALALSISCWLEQERGQATESMRPRLAHALALARQGQDVRAQALIVRLQAAQAAYHLADPAAAEPLLQDSIRLFAQVGDITQVSFRQTELAWCWAQLGRLDAALALLTDIARQEAASQNPPIMIYVLTVLGQVQLQRRQAQAAAQALHKAVQLALLNDWLALLPKALLPLPEAWLVCGMAPSAARLQGHLLASWPDTLGPFNRVQLRSNRRTRLLLVQRLGSQRCAQLLAQGGQLSREQALQMVHNTAAQGVNA